MAPPVAGTVELGVKVVNAVMAPPIAGACFEPLEVKVRAEQVEVVGGDPPVKVAAPAVLKYPGVKLKTILPMAIRKIVEVVNARVKVPTVAVPGIISAATEAVAIPLPLAVPPAVIDGTVPEPAVSMITPPGNAVVAAVEVMTL